MERDTRDSSFSKVIHSPADSTSQSTGFETNSETSLRSPSGLSSLPSIGSPSSVSSPQTCAASSYYESPIPINILSNGSGNNDWFRQNTHAGIGIPSAFKPLTSTSSASSISQYRVTSSPKMLAGASDSTGNNYHFPSGESNFSSASFNGIMNINANSSSVISNQSQNIRTRVGADPRDAKNPLSISQLTGNINANDQLHENRHFSKDFMSSNGSVSMNGLTDIGETTTRHHHSRRNSVSEKLNRTLPAGRISSLIV